MDKLQTRSSDSIHYSMAWPRSGELTVHEGMMSLENMLCLVHGFIDLTRESRKEIGKGITSPPLVIMENHVEKKIG